MLPVESKVRDAVVGLLRFRTRLSRFSRLAFVRPRFLEVEIPVHLRFASQWNHGTAKGEAEKNPMTTYDGGLSWVP